jgi:cysteine desulfurase family protein (TIGR01976 family)
VIDAVADYMRRCQVQLGATYALSAEASERVRAGHAAIERWIGAEPGEVVLGPSTTVNLKILAAALRPLWKEGDEVVVTNLDHESNVGPWRDLAATGITVREWRFRPETVGLALEDLDALLNERTRLVAVTHCSNLVGAIVDVAAVARRVHEAGALVAVDGVAYAPHRRLDVKAWDVDFYAASLYKTYGPHLALLYGKRDLLLQARGQYNFFIAEDDVPYKLQPGNVNHELAAALPEVLRYFERLDEHHFPGEENASLGQRLDRVYGLVREHEERLAGRLLDFLRTKENVRILGPACADGAVRMPTISFVVEGRRSSEIPPLLDEKRLAVRFGHFYAYRPVRDLGLLERDGVVRASLVHYNRQEEVDRLVAALDEIL